ncbi:phage tail length tape-measure protein [Sulfuriferula multivorans]|uniref:Phage tail length tape-measure protein n=1 Tax=Sulfuriferula multivorans TaxID=1559896 RepID=A0A401JA28_9PROT|nr:hypothetical protein [Sulfuriferula multivorans]GBL44424.1 phage tail length tape-measure protein [Sulfuriferula multivorans]
MSNKFTITIHAVDKATAIVRKINRSTAEITRPISLISKSITSMGKEVKRNSIIQFTEKIGKSALGAAESIAKVASPFGTLVGGAASIGGIAALADAWGKSGIAIEYASRRTGIAVGTLQQYRAAATAAGLSATDMQSALVGLGSTLQDVDYGRGDAKVKRAILRTMGMDKIPRTKAGAVDTTRALGDIADYISKLKDPNAQAEMADLFGLGSILPLLQEGRKGIQKYLDKVKKAGADNEKAAAANKQLGDSWNSLKVEIDGVSNSLSQRYSPSLTKAIDNTTTLIQKIRDGSTLKEASKPMLSDVAKESEKHPLSKMIPGIGIIDYLYGSDSSGRTASGKIRFKSSIPGANGKPRDPLGIRSNNPFNLQPRGKELTFPSADAGILAGTRNLIKNYRGMSIAQMAHKYTPDGAPGNPVGTEAAWAASVAKNSGMSPSDIPDLSNPKSLAPLLSAIIRHENGKNPYSKDQIEAAAQKVTVEVMVKGNTHGVTATARSDGSGTNVPTPRVFYPMPNGDDS